MDFSQSFGKKRDSHDTWREKLHQLKISKQVPDAAMLLTPLKKMIHNRYLPQYQKLKEL